MTKAKNPAAFVIMPITTNPNQYTEDPKNHFINVYKYLIEPSLKKAGYTTISPITEGSDLIQADIIKKLENSEMVLCDMSQLNPNVFFEFGVRTAINKPVCLIRDDRTNQNPFDVSPINTHEYCSQLRPWNINDEIGKLVKHIEATKKKSPKTNSFWTQLGFSKQSKPVDTSDQNMKMKLLELENSSLKQEVKNLKLSKRPTALGGIEMAYVHKCTKCGFGIKVSGYYGSAGVGVWRAPSSVSLAGLTPSQQQVLTCPSCGNVDILY